MEWFNRISSYYVQWITLYPVGAQTHRCRSNPVFNNRYKPDEDRSFGKCHKSYVHAHTCLHTQKHTFLQNYHKRIVGGTFSHSVGQTLVVKMHVWSPKRTALLCSKNNIGTNVSEPLEAKDTPHVVRASGKKKIESDETQCNLYNLSF